VADRRELCQAGNCRVKDHAHRVVGVRVDRSRGREGGGIHADQVRLSVAAAQVVKPQLLQGSTVSHFQNWN